MNGFPNHIRPVDDQKRGFLTGWRGCQSRQAGLQTIRNNACRPVALVGFFFEKGKLLRQASKGEGGIHTLRHRKKAPGPNTEAKQRWIVAGGCAHFGHSSSALGCICVGINLGFNSGLMYFNSSGLKSNKGGRGFPFGSRTLGSRNSSKSW